MEKQLKEKVDFGMIRYANCWEDADVLLEGLKVEPNSRILSIGSAGDNSFSLLTTNPELVVAVDINSIQLYLIELKKVCFAHLTHEQMIAFLGFRPCSNRAQLFDALKPYLSEAASAYWTNHIEQVKAGVISQGKFEQYFQLFSRKVMPLIHSKSVTEELLATKSAKDQKRFYQKKWNNWRWRGLFSIFFSKYVMGKLGRDPEFMREVKVPVSQFMFNKAQQHLESVEAQDNHILRYNLTGSFGDMLPHYLRKENFEVIKANLHKLHIAEGYAEDCIPQFGRFNYMNLSNIFEYMNNSLFTQTARTLLAAMEKGGRIAYWNLMVPRKMSALFPGKAEWLDQLSSRLSLKDKGFFYNQFIIEQVK